MKIITRKEAEAQGLKRYFTGEPCKQGHVAERHVSSEVCLECNRQRCRQYRAENREKGLEYYRQYREENRERYTALSAKRHAAKLQRTLAHEEELTDFVMQEASQQAKDMEELFGTPFHVDHMIPMQGRKVSGLHVYYNLQVIPAHLNIGKGNRMRYTKPLEWLADAA